MIWLLPSAIALLIKCFLFFYSDVHKKKYFFLFLIATFLLNLFELLVAIRPGYDLIVLKMYYCMAVFTIFYLAVVCSDISKMGRFIKSDLSLVATCILVATILLTDHIVQGFSILPNNALTRISGTYYFIFQIYAVAILVFPLVLLISKLVISKDYRLKIRCCIALFAFTPFISFTLVLIILMQLGYQINMVGFSSLCLSFMLIVFISLSDQHKLFTMMQFVPFSKERQYHLKMQRLIRQFDLPVAGESVQMKTLLKEIEALVIDNTHNYFSTQKEVAKVLNISESNISRKVDKQEKNK